MYLTSTIRAGFVLALLGTSLPACGSDETALFNSNKPPDTQEGPFVPADGGVRRLLGRQYMNTVAMLLGSDAAAVQDLLPTDHQLQGYLEIGAAETPPGLSYPEQWDDAATKVAQLATANPAQLATIVPCVTKAPQDPCYDTFAADFGRLAFRHTLDAEEKAAIVSTAKAAEAKLGTFMAGIEYALRQILQSPSFLYIVEVGESDPKDATRRRLTPQELATRMSFFLTDTGPSAELLDMADAGQLDSEDDIRAQAEKLVATPAAQASLRARFHEVLYLDQVLDAQKSTDVFPEFTDAVRAAMVTQAELLVDDIVWKEDGDAREIFTSKSTIVDDVLAPIYGVPAPPPGQWLKVTIPKQDRAGFLTSGAFLARASHAVTTSPTRRGTFIKERVLCEPVPPPAAGVNITLADPKPGEAPKTMKQIMEAHLKEERCKNCHSQFDPYGFAFEHFDAIGRYRTTDAGQKVDSSGTIVGFGSFTDARDLADKILADDQQRISHCIITTLWRGSIGHVETQGERPALDDLHQRFVGSGFKLKQLLVDTTVSPAFLYVAALGQ